jgi:uncharacterized membrane protein YgdD (TMEM256/DUF423 family)
MSSDNQHQTLRQTWFVRAFALMTGCAVALGAFGAHALKAIRTEQQLETWKTATLYLMVHGVAGLALSLYNCTHSLQNESVSRGCPRAALKLLMTGALVFSVSLYLLVLLKIPMLGAITPVGGVAMIAGWLIVVFRFKT